MAAAQRGGLIRKTKHRTPVRRSFLIGPTISFPLLLFPAQDLSLHSGPNAHPYSREAQASLQNLGPLATPPLPWSWVEIAPLPRDQSWSTWPGGVLKSESVHTREKKFLWTSSQRSAPPNLLRPLHANFWVSNQKASMALPIELGRDCRRKQLSSTISFHASYGETDGECLTGVMPTLLKRKNPCKLSQPHAFVDIFFS